MTVLKKIKPKFWDHVDAASGPFAYLFNFRRMWQLAVLLTVGVAVVPLVAMTAIDYQVTQKSIESEIALRISRLVSNTRRAVSFFLEERRLALDFIVRDNSFESLNDPERLQAILKNLQTSFGGFIDLGVIDTLGYQRNYAGPYRLEGVDYSEQAWYREVLERGVHISDVFPGFRQVPHLIIAVKHEVGGGSPFVLRATLDTERFNQLISHPEMAEGGDAFLINSEGKLQTPSLSHGKILDTSPLPVPSFSPNTELIETEDAQGQLNAVGYAYIEDSPFILMIVKNKKELLKPWYKTRLQLMGFLAASITIILVVILGVATYLVNKIYVADQKRLTTLHQVEYSNKMATIGRLAAGVAHEINNPLAVINEKAGLIKDILNMREESTKDEKLMNTINSVLSSVERCAKITRRLLSFMRNSGVTTERIHLGETIQEVLTFLSKEAEYRSFQISVHVDEDVPQITGDRGRLQEIFLNVINNSFAAMQDGGHLEVTAKRDKSDLVSVAVKDDGCGIPKADLERVFEPFFSTKTGKGGTGLGLSITSGLVQELGGEISVASEIGKGTIFTIVLPINNEKKGETVS
ncbi:MAG: two-component sensor histidine kinase [Deltaproteobacteria bacterium]|jgi:signal transduction histidine kinase|nr:two-component sensor histidine kinase [Deltaproteobacteria bacterium]